MKKLKWVFIFILTLIAVNLGGMIAGVCAGDRSLGEELVHRLWADVKAGDVVALENMMAPGFQSMHEDGARDRKGELQIIKGVNLGNYTLTNLKVTRNGPVLIVTYFVSVEESLK